MTPIAPDAAPREIVAALHAEIAAKSPRHAALVAAFEAVPRPVPRPPRRPRPPAHHRARRLTMYGQLRIAGRSPRAAAEAVFLGPSSASQYEADFLATLGGMP